MLSDLEKLINQVVLIDYVIIILGEKIMMCMCCCMMNMCCMNKREDMKPKYCARM